MGDKITESLYVHAVTEHEVKTKFQKVKKKRFLIGWDRNKNCEAIVRYNQGSSTPCL